jgi:hypothetical protein
MSGEGDDDSSKVHGFVLGGDSSALSAEGQEIAEGIENLGQGSSEEDEEEEGEEGEDPSAAEEEEEEDEEVDEQARIAAEEARIAAEEAAALKAREEAEAQKLLNIQIAKSLVGLLMKETRSSGNSKSNAWDYVRAVELMNGAAESLEEMGFVDLEAQTKWKQKIVEGKEDYMYVYLTCYNNLTVKLDKCIVMGQRSGPGNVSHHLPRVHGVEPKGGYKGKNKSPHKLQPAPLPPQTVMAQSSNPRALAFAAKPASRPPPSKRQKTEVSPGNKSGKSNSPGKVSVAGSTLGSKDAFLPMKQKGA